MANEKFSDLPTKATPAATDIVAIVDEAGSPASKATTVAGILTYINTAVATQTNKTFTAPVVNSPTGIVKGDVGLGNVDNTSDATKDAASVTLTNKTLTSPIINTPTGIVKGDVGLGNVDNTSDATKNAASVTLTNKTLTAPIIASISNSGTVTLPTGSVTLVARNTTDTLTNKTMDNASNTFQNVPDYWTVAISDETTALVAGTLTVTFRAPYAGKLSAIPSASVNTVSSSGLPTFDVNINGTSIFSTTLTIDANEKTSLTAATPAVMTSNPLSFSLDDEFTIDIDTAGTGTKGAKIIFYVTH